MPITDDQFTDYAKAVAQDIKELKNRPTSQGNNSSSVDTFATLNGNLITFADGQEKDITPVVDTDTDTFATISGGIITFPNGDVVNLNSFGTDTFATLNGNTLTLADGQIFDLTKVVDTDTDTFATLSGNTISFPDGSSISIPTGNSNESPNISNEHSVIVSNVTDLTNPENTGKELLITQDIELIEDITLPENSIVTYCGGVINVSSFKVTFLNNDIYNSKWDFSNGTIGSQSTLSSEIINVVNFGTIGDYDLETNLGTDNRNILIQLSKLAIFNNVDLVFKNCGYIGYSLLEPKQDRSEPNNFYVSKGVNVIFHKGTKLCALRSNITSYDVLEVWKGENNLIKGTGEFHIVGDLKTHDFNTLGTSEGCHGIKINNNSLNVVIDGVSSKEFSGDCGICRYNPEFVHLNTVVEDSFTKNSNINDEGEVIANDYFSYSQRFLVTNQSFKDIKGFVFGGGSFAGNFGLDIQEYKVAYYNENSLENDTTTGLIFVSDLIETYQRIPLLENTTHIRLIISTPSDWTILRGSIYAPTLSNYITIKNLTLTNGVRQGWSNLSPFSTFDNVRFINNGRRFDGVTGSPGFGFDSEDGYQNLNHITIKNSTFKNNKGGDIILKGSRYFNIHGCKFLFNDNPEQVNVNAISLSNGRYTNFHNNVVQDREISTGRGDRVHSNILKNSQITYSFEEEVIEDNHDCKNIKFNKTIDFNENGLTYIKNNTFSYTSQLDNLDSFRSFENVIYEGNIFNFNGNSHNSTTKRLSNLTNVNFLPKGRWINNRLENLIPEVEYSDGFQIYAYEIKNSYFSTNLDIRRGLSMDFKLDNIVVDGWVNFELNDYPKLNNDGEYNTAYVTNSFFKVTNFSYLGTGGRNLITTEDVDVNINFNNCSFIINIGSHSNSNKFFSLDHHGTTEFINCVFSTEKTDTQVGIYNTDLNPITFIDCVFNNISLVLRNQDLLLYTKPDANCPSFANAQDAVSKMGVGYYYINSTTNQFEISI